MRLEIRYPYKDTWEALKEKDDIIRTFIKNLKETGSGFCLFDNMRDISFEGKDEEIHKVAKEFKEKHPHYTVEIIP